MCLVGAVHADGQQTARNRKIKSKFQYDCVGLLETTAAARCQRRRRMTSAHLQLRFRTNRIPRTVPCRLARMPRRRRRRCSLSTGSDRPEAGASQRSRSSTVADCRRRGGSVSARRRMTHDRTDSVGTANFQTRAASASLTLLPSHRAAVRSTASSLLWIRHELLTDLFGAYTHAPAVQ